MVLTEEEDGGVVVTDEEDPGVVAAKEEADAGVAVAEEEFRKELLPSEFLPKAWASFHLDHQQLHQLAMGEVELAMEQHSIAEVDKPVSGKRKARLMLRG